jgi:taurine dioxygenase
MTLSIEPLSQNFASEVVGLDLRNPQDDATKQALYQAFAERSVLVFRDQKLEPPEFLSAVSTFGTPQMQELEQFLVQDCPLVGFISSRDKGASGKTIVRGSNWHTDHSHTETPPRATTLHAVTLPSEGGDTQFANMHLAYDALPDDIREKADLVKCLHIWMSRRCPRPMGTIKDGFDPRVWHPLVRTNPDNGRRALYMNTARIDEFQGIDLDEGFDLIDTLMDFSTQPQFEYRHSWRPGDLVIWDNRAVMHQANGDFGDQYRYLYRIIIEGEPVLDANGRKLGEAA